MDIEDGIPLSYFIQAEFTGPHITIVEPNVEFGLQKINSHAAFTMSVTNHSPIDAPILIKNANDFMSHSFSAFYEELSKAVKSDKEGDQNSQRKRQKSARTITTKEGNKVYFQPQYLVIPPNSRGEITVTLSCNKEEIIASEILEVMVKDGESQFINLNANIQKIKVCLNRYSMDLGKIYAGIKQNIDSRHSQSIVLRNYGNIPAKFQWNEKIIPDRIKVQFDPARGTIAPHSEFVVNFRMISYIGGPLEEVFT